MSSQSQIRVLSIAHSAVSRDAGRLRYYPFALKDGLDVHLLAPSRWREYGRRMNADPGNDPGVTLHLEPILLPYLPAINWYAHFYPRLKRVIDRLKPDVIHLWEEPWSVVALQATILRRSSALVLEVDQNILKRLPQPFEKIRRHVLQQTDVILSRSDDATMVARACGFDGPSKSIGYGVDQSTFFPAPAAPKSPNTVLRLGYVGRVMEEKGLDEALIALSLVRFPIDLEIMGEGPHDAELRKRVREFGLEQRVHFRGWGKPQEVAEFLRSLDISLVLSRSSPTWREQFGRTIIESQSCGIPVIGSSCGAIPAVVGEGGWIVPERDPKTLADLLEYLCGAREQIKARGFAGQANVAARFTYETVAQALSEAWKEANALKSQARSSLPQQPGGV